MANWDVTSKAQQEIAFTPARVLLQDFTGVPAVVDLAAMRDGIVRLGGDPRKVNPLQPVELVIDHSVQVDHYAEANAARPQRGARVLPEPRTLRLPALGTGGVPELPGRSPGHRHRPPGQPRVSRARGVQGGGGRRGARVPRHARRHGLAHHDGERAGRRRVGRRRYRGRSRDARTADLDADSGSRRIPARRPAAGGRDRDRSGPDDHGAAAEVRRRGQVRRVLRTWSRVPDDRRSSDPGQHVAGVRRHDRDLPDRRDDPRLPPPHQPRRIPRPAGRSLCEGAGTLPDRRGAGSRLYRRRSSWISRRSNRASRVRSARRTASRCDRPRSASSRRSTRC